MRPASEDTKVIEFFVPGRPVPERRQKILVRTANGIKARHIRDARVEAWKQKIAQYALAVVGAGRPLFPTEPLRLDLQFYFPPTKKMKPEDLPIVHTKRPDADNLYKACADALTGIIWADDSQVVASSCEKWYGEPPGVRIKIRRLG